MKRRDTLLGRWGSSYSLRRLGLAQVGSRGSAHFGMAVTALYKPMY